MIDYKIKTGCYGIYFIADYLTLRWLHSAIHSLAENCFCNSIMDEDGGVFALAYNVRKAYEGKRKKYPPDKFYPEMPVRYGFDLPWPLIFYWVKVLQESVARQNPDKFVKSVIFHLEAIIELAAKDEFKDQADQVIEKWQRMDVSKPFCHNAIFSRVNYFEAANPKSRRRYVLDVLDSLDEVWSLSYSEKSHDFQAQHLNPRTFEAEEYTHQVF
jgi:hypothetical protein